MAARLVQTNAGVASGKLTDLDGAGPNWELPCLLATELPLATVCAQVPMRLDSQTRWDCWQSHFRS